MLIVIAAATLAALGLVRSRPISIDRGEPVEAWIKRASCTNTDVQDFFSEENQGTTLQVQALCAGCPVRSQCLRTAMESSMLGYWGSTTTAQRRSGYSRLFHQLKGLSIAPLRFFYR